MGAHSSPRAHLFKNLVALILVFTSLAVFVAGVLAYQTSQQQAEQIARRDKALSESQSEASKALEQARVNGEQLTSLLGEVHRQNVLLATQAASLESEKKVIDQFREDLAKFGFTATVRDGKVTIVRSKPDVAPRQSREHARPSTPTRQAQPPRISPPPSSIWTKPSPAPGHPTGGAPKPTPGPVPTGIPTLPPAPTPGPTSTPHQTGIPTITIGPLPTVVPLPSVLPTCILAVCLPKGPS